MKIRTNLSLYCVSERPEYVARMLQSISTGSILPKRIILVGTKQQYNNGSGEWNQLVYRSAEAILQAQGVQVLGIFYDRDHAGIVRGKNVALSRLYSTGHKNEFALSIDDDMVFEPLTLQRLVEALEEHPQMFAAGPVIRQEGNKSLCWSPELYTPKMFEVDRYGTWNWRGFRQGLYYDGAFVDHTQELEAEHLCCTYVHRLDGSYYDTEYDKGNYFLHESDYVYRRGCLVVTNAVTHHWPPEDGNLSNQRKKYADEILEAAQYFAHKFAHPKVERINWKGFERVGPTGIS